MGKGEISGQEASRANAPRRWMTIPEVDCCAWFDLPTAAVEINAAQAEFIERLQAALR